MSGVQQHPFCDHAVLRLRVQVLQAREIREHPIHPSRKLTFAGGCRHGHPRQVSPRHGFAGQALKQGGLAGVGVADECEIHDRNLGWV